MLFTAYGVPDFMIEDSELEQLLTSEVLDPARLLLLLSVSN